jgi:xylulokinase
MGKNILIGIDIGTTTIKAVFLDTDGEKILGTELEEITQIRKRPDWAEYDAAVWWDSVKMVLSRGITSLKIDPGSVAGICCGGFTVAGFMVDREGNPLNNPTHYTDMRHLGEVEDLKEKIGKKAVEINNNAMGPYNTLPKQVWFRNHEPELFRKAKYFMTEAGWIVYKLTGEWSCNRSEAGFCAQYDYKTGQWSEEILDAVGIPVDMFPPLFDAWEKVGEVTVKASEETKLAQGTPVFAGTDDAGPAAVTTGVIREGQCCLSLGSGCNIGSNISKPLFHPTCLFYPHCIPGLYMFISVMVSVGINYKWVRDTVARTELSMASLLDEDPYALMEKEAAGSRPGSGGVLMLPYLEGEYTPIDDSNARAVFAGISSSTSRGDIMRSVMEGTAMSLLHNIVTIEELGGNLKELMVTGGPVRSRTWMQIVADVTGRPVSIPEESDGAPFGNAIVAGFGAGIFPDYETAVKKMVRVKRNAFVPNKENSARYREIFDVYLKLYPALKEIFGDLSAIRG